MALRTLWNALRSPESKSAVPSWAASPSLQTISQGLQEQRRVIDQLKRYEEITYSFVARRVAFLQQELAAIFHAAPDHQEVLADRRIQERRKADRPVAIERRKGTDRRMSQQSGAANCFVGSQGVRK